MGYDKILPVDLENCEIISRVVEMEEIQDPSVLNIWMLHNNTKVNRISMTYLIYEFEKKKYTSEVLYESLDSIRLKLIKKKSTTIYIDTLKDTYFFDLRFLREE